MSDKRVTLAVEGPHNECLHFRPINQRLRGRFDYLRDTEPAARLAAGDWTDDIPGIRYGYDFERRCGFVHDPLNDPEFSHVRERIEALGFKPGPVRKEFPDADAATWLYWMRRAVEAGLAVVIEGKLPSKLHLQGINQTISPVFLVSAWQRLLSFLTNLEPLKIYYPQLMRLRACKLEALN